MRIRKVTLEGFGPFKEQQEVDFAEFDADGLFLIGGETGAGKSSILDGIAYALYGSTPRWEDSSATGVGNRVRSDYCGIDDPTRVVLEFEANGIEYRVTRSPAYQRPKDRGEGTTTQPAKILVEVLEGDTWQGLANKEREAAEVIERLVKLTGEEFLQVILLAQGRFQAFLLANSEERLGLLSKLFGAKRFHEYQDRVLARRSALLRQVDASRMQFTTLLGSVAAPESLDGPTTGHELEWIDLILDGATDSLDNAAAQIDATEAQEKAAEERLQVASKQRQVADAQTRLEELDAQKPEIELAKTALKSAERAERVRPLIDAAEAALKKREDADRELTRARSHYKGDTADDLLPAEVTRLDGELAKLVDAVQDEERTDALQRDHEGKLAEVNDLSTELAEITEEIDGLQTERTTLVAPAAQLQLRQEKVARIEERLTSAKSADDARTRLKTAQEVQLAADQKYGAAHLLATQTLARFLHGQAASLAARLVDGEPCAVCGSTEHPAPATSEDSPVSQEDLDEAQGAVDKLEPRAKAAKEAVDGITTELAQLTGAAGVGDVASITVELKSAREELAEATGAVKRIEEIDADLNGDDGLIADKKAREQDLKDASAEAARLKTERDTLQEKVLKLRGDFPTVKARHEVTTTEREAANALASALTSLATAAKAFTDAESSFDAKAKQEGFERRATAIEALLGDEDVAELRARVDAHQAAISETQGILKQPDLQDLPSEPIDFFAAQEALAVAKSAAKVAVSEHADSKSRLGTLQGQRKKLQKLLAASDDLVAEFEALNRLTETIHGRTPNTKGMSLESYYVAAELEEVLAAANARLGVMSSGRYTLQHTERGTRRANVTAGLELEVMDEYTGKARDPHTLSGGEQFLTSLALALGLAEVVTSRAGGVELETLFVDEGFGSLSPEFLDIAMATLDSLKQGGRTVGIISHVESMKESIASQLQVVRNPGGGSLVKHTSMVA